MVKPNPKLEQEKLALIEEKIEKSFLKTQEEFETDDTEDIIETLSEPLSIDYVEKWKVYARMKLAERNFERSEMMRKSLIQKLIHTQEPRCHSRCTGRQEDTVDFEIQDKMRLKDRSRVYATKSKRLKNLKRFQSPAKTSKKVLQKRLRGFL